jgi:chromosome segregation ATPase
LVWFKKETQKLNALVKQYDKNVEQYNKNVEQHNKNVEQHNKNYKELHSNFKNLHSNAYKLTNDLKKISDAIQQLHSKIGNPEEPIAELCSVEIENDISCDTFSVISCDIDKYAYATRGDLSSNDNGNWLFNIF